MSARLVILQGGEDVKNRSNQDMFENVARMSKTGKVLVIPWTSNLLEKEMQYREIFKEYFRDVGFGEIAFLERSDTGAEIDSKFSDTDVLYLPGGDPSILKREMESRSIQKKILEFNGIIIGNSAGAIVLSKGGYAFGETEFNPGFGILDFYVRVHLKIESPPVSNSDRENTLGILEDSWISVKP